MGEEFNLVKVAHRHRSCLSIRRALSSIIGGYPRPSVALISVGMPVSVEPDDSSSEIEPPTVEMPRGLKISALKFLRYGMSRHGT